MKISSLIISILLVGVLFTGFYTFVNDLASPENYDLAVDNQYMNTFDKTNNLSMDIQKKYDNMQNFSTKKSSTIQIITLIPDALSLMKDIIILPYRVTSVMINDLARFINLPSWVTTFIVAVITILLLFAIISMILRWNET